MLNTQTNKKHNSNDGDITHARAHTRLQHYLLIVSFENGN